MAPNGQHNPLANRRSTTSMKSVGASGTAHNMSTGAGTDKEVSGNTTTIAANPNHNSALGTNRKHKPVVTHIKYRRNGSLGRGLNKLGFTITNNPSLGHLGDNNINPDELKRCKSSDAILLKNSTMRKSKSHLKNGGGSELSITGKRRPLATKKILQLHISDDDDDEYEDLENDEEDSGLNVVPQSNLQKDLDSNNQVLDTNGTSQIINGGLTSQTDDSHLKDHTNQQYQGTNNETIETWKNLPTMETVQSANNNVVGRNISSANIQTPPTNINKQTTPMTTALRNKMATNLSNQQQTTQTSPLSPLRPLESSSSSSSSQSSISPHQAKYGNNDVNVRHSNSAAQIHRSTKSTVPATRTQQKLWLQRESVVIDQPSSNYATGSTDGNTSSFISNNGSSNFHTSYSQVSLCNPEHKREFERINHEFIGLRAISNPVLEGVDRYVKLNKSIRNPKRDGANDAKSNQSWLAGSNSKALTINKEHEGYDEQRNGLSQSVPRHAFEVGGAIDKTSNHMHNGKPMLNRNLTTAGTTSTVTANRGLRQQGGTRNKAIPETTDVSEALMKLWKSGWKSTRDKLFEEPAVNANNNITITNGVANGDSNVNHSSQHNNSVPNDTGSNNEVPALRLRAQQIQRQMAMAAQQQETQQLQQQQQRQAQPKGNGNGAVKLTG